MSGWKSELVKVATTQNHSFANKRACTAKPVGGEGFDCEIVSEYDGMVVLQVDGDGAFDAFKAESGGHRWQRVPPNERKDKTHSSTVTVAVIRAVPQSQFSLLESDLEYTTCRGSGPGGQKRNKTESAVQVKHKPTGLFVRCDSERSQGQNKESAKALLAARVKAIQDAKANRKSVDDRRQQIGSGERSDKIRTVQMQNGQVVNHATGRKAPVERYLKGDIWCVA